MQFYTKKSNAQRAALRKATQDGGIYKVEAAGNGQYVLAKVEVVREKKAQAVAKKITAATKVAPAKISNPAKAGVAAAKANDAQRDALRAAKAPIPASLTGVAEPARAGGKKAAALEAASRGVLPTPPDFTANTHKPYRAKLAKLIALVDARDAKGLAAFAINPTSTSPKAMIRYRDLAITAIRAGKGA